MHTSAAIRLEQHAKRFKQNWMSQSMEESHSLTLLFADCCDHLFVMIFNPLPILLNILYSIFPFVSDHMQIFLLNKLSEFCTAGFIGSWPYPCFRFRKIISNLAEKTEFKNDRNIHSF